MKKKLLIAAILLLAACHRRSIAYTTYYDLNGDTKLIVTKTKLTFVFHSYQEEYRYKVVHKGSYTYLDSEKGGFDLIGPLEVTKEGDLLGYEQVLDAEGHTYRFMTKEALEKERKIVDLSEDAPKTITSHDITEFHLSFHKSNGRSYGLSDDWENGGYSIEITMKNNQPNLDIFVQGSSYVIFSYNDSISQKELQELDNLIRVLKIPEYNGYYVKNNVHLPSYGLSVEYASHESISIHAYGNGADTCVFDLPGLMDFFARYKKEANN